MWNRRRSAIFNCSMRGAGFTLRWFTTTTAAPFSLWIKARPAIAAFNDAIRIDPKSDRTFARRGLAYARKGDNDRAITDFNEAIRLNPKNDRAFAGRGFVYARKGDED